MYDECLKWKLEEYIHTKVSWLWTHLPDFFFKTLQNVVSFHAYQNYFIIKMGVTKPFLNHKYLKLNKECFKQVV